MRARQDEFERVAICHARSLLRVARRLTSGSGEAEDLVQECLLRAWRGFHQFREGTNARAWLFRILVNTFHERGRKTRVEIVPIEADVRAANSSLDESIEVSRALDDLSLEHRTVLMLAAAEGFTCREISEILGVPVGTVMSRLGRARQAMRARLTARAASVACAGKENA